MGVVVSKPHVLGSKFAAEQACQDLNAGLVVVATLLFYNSLKLASQVNERVGREPPRLSQ